MYFGTNNMKYYIFKNENDDFRDLLADPVLKKEFNVRVRWKNHLLLGNRSIAPNQNILSYVNLKFGESMVSVTKVIPDHGPVMFKDYHPGKLPKFPLNKKDNENT